MQVKHRKFVASTNPPSETVMTKFWRRKHLENEAKREKRQCVETKDMLIPIVDGTTNPTEIEPPKVQDDASEGSAPSEPMTRRRYKEITETLIKQQSFDAKRRTLEDQSLKRESNTKVQGVKVEQSKLREVSNPSSSSKRPKLNDADAAIERLLKTGVTPNRGK